LPRLWPDVLMWMPIDPARHTSTKTQLQE